jgi:NAD(P)-dependent dehydrogenase (short-subunit alcohol dehydrogenase family)
VVGDVRRAVETVAHEAGGLHAAVCAAGVVKVGELEHSPVEDVDLMLDVNVKATWLVIREAIPWLRKVATDRDPARVVVLGSIAGIRPKVAGGIYAATKAALHVLV